MLTYITTACMMTALMMAGSSLGEDRKPQMEIDLEGTTDIVPPLTKSLNLTCSLVRANDSDPNDEKADFVSITGVYITLKAPGGGAEADVAKITSFKPDEPKLSGLLPRAKIIGFGLSEGFIKVGVEAPDINHAGDYRCKIVGFNTAEDPVTLTHKTFVQYKDPDNIKILAKYIHTLELQLEKKDTLLEEKDASLDTDISNIKTKDINEIIEKNRNQDTEINNIKTKDIYDIKRKNRHQDIEINNRVSKGDIEQGYQWCYPGTGDNTDYKQINFINRYSTAPKVFLSARYIYGNAAVFPDRRSTDDNTGSEYSIDAYPVTQTGFRLGCTVWEKSYIEQMGVQWIAFPSP